MLENILQRLHGVVPNANGHQAKCPCHEDKRASLSISENNGKFLLYCHAGCSVDDICRAIGINQSDLFSESPKQKAKLQEVCRYIYTDENGAPVHATIRYEPKTFRQVALNPNGTIREWTLKNTRTVLYNLPRILSSDTVYLVEGEKDADRLKSLGFAATTSPMGAGKWRTDYTEILRNKDVIIIPDNDAAGANHADIVSKALLGVAKSVRIAQLTGVANKGDVSDFLASASSIDEARQMILSLELAQKQNENNAAEPKKECEINLKEWTDVGVADAFANFYGNIARYSTSLGWLVWNGKKWELNNLKAQNVEISFTDILLQQARKSGDADYMKFAVKMRSYNKIQSVLSTAKSILEISNDDLDIEPCDLNTPNGIVDLRTGKIRPHESSAFCTKMTAVSPTPQRSELFEKFLSDITLGNSDLAQYVQCVAGMACLGKVYSEVLIIAYGDGHNGKSTLFNTLYEILGDYSGKIPAEALTTRARNPKNDVAELFGKRLVVASETEEGNRLSTAMLKQIASTDPMTAEKKYHDPFVFTPTHSLILFTNYLPKIGSDDLGTWRRLVPVPFNAKIEKPQLDLAERLLNEAGGSILQWVIDGAKIFIENGYRLPICSAVEDAKSQYKAENDWLANFIEERCIVGDVQAEAAVKLYEAYVDWSLKNGEYKRCNRDFAHALEAKGFTKKKGRRGNSWHGLAVMSDFENYTR